MTEMKLLLSSGVVLEQRSISSEHLERNECQIKLSLYIYTNICIHHRDGMSHLNIRGQDHINDLCALKWSFLPRYLTIVPDFCSLWASLRGIINEAVNISQGHCLRLITLYQAIHLVYIQRLLLTGIISNRVTYFSVVRSISPGNTYRFTSLLVCRLGAYTFR